MVIFLDDINPLERLNALIRTKIRTTYVMSKS